MRQAFVPLTTATGMGPLPSVLEKMSGRRAVYRVFQETGIPLELVEQRELKIPLAAMIALFNRAEKEACDETFGLRVGSEMKPGAYGLWTRYAGQGKTVRQALVRLCSTLGVHQTGGSMRLRCHDSQVTWTYANPSCFRAVERAQAEHVVPVMIGFLRPFLGPNWLPNWIGVPFPDDGSGVKRSELFACSWRYEQEGVSLSFSAELLDETREADAEQLVCTRAEVDAARMRRDARSPVYVAKQIIALRLMEGKVDVEGAARLAGQSLRTFQRSLEREGVSYSKLLILVRRERAEALLRENALSGTEIAFRLGFADPANFTRAFRSWAGVSPSRFRELDGESR